MQTSNTNNAIGKLPLIPEMLVMITENAATSCKIVNGSKGILKSVTYDIDEDGNRYAVCVLVDIPESTLQIPGLNNGVIPIFPVINSFSMPLAEKTVNVRRTQLPKAVVDLAGAKSLQSIYVILSCASQLQNVAVLRWFSSKVLHSDLQGDACQELTRLRHVEMNHKCSSTVIAARVSSWMRSKWSDCSEYWLTLSSVGGVV
ncbi:hypothetical protein DFH29DRAFT_929327 [Suillus ampliporus]|nr:hypothetical protein DFH29DRAFT_929327 [Suillus ampliporus]